MITCMAATQVWDLNGCWAVVMAAARPLEQVADLLDAGDVFVEELLPADPEVAQPAQVSSTGSGR